MFPATKNHRMRCQLQSNKLMCVGLIELFLSCVESRLPKERVGSKEDMEVVHFRWLMVVLVGRRGGVWWGCMFCAYGHAYIVVFLPRPKVKPIRIIAFIL